MNKSTLWAIIVVLITIIIWMTRCNDKGTIITNIDTVVDTSYIHDTVTVRGKTKIKPYPVPYYVHDTVIDSSGRKIIIEVKKFITNDTFEYKTDSFTITFFTKIYSNGPLDSIQSDMLSSIRHKIIERTITKEVVREHAFFAGPSIGIGKTTGYISLDGLYERKGKIIYRAGVGVNNQFRPMLKAGVYWQISK